MASSGRRASRLAIGAIALIAGMALPLGGCGEDDKALDPQQLRPRSGLEQIRSLPGGKDRLEQRPATCRRTHAVLIAAGKPHPARLEVRPGDCVVWGNKGAADVGVQSVSRPPRMSGKRTFGALFGFAMTIGAREVGAEILGPVTRLTPAQAFRWTRPGGEDLPYPYGADKTPVKVSYTVTPSGGKGAIILLAEGGGSSKPGGGRPAGGLEEIRRLRGGDRTVEQRPAGCRATHAVLIAAGKPEPATLMAELGDCVIWGNKGAVSVEVASAIECRGYRSCSTFSRTVGRRRAAGAVGPLKNLHADLGGRIPYTISGLASRSQGPRIEPGGGKGTIVLK